MLFYCLTSVVSLSIHFTRSILRKEISVLQRTGMLTLVSPKPMFLRIFSVGDSPGEWPVFLDSEFSNNALSI